MAIRILANDGLESSAVKYMREKGIDVVTDNVPQSDLKTALLDFDGLVVRSATKVTGEVMKGQPRLKFVGRAGVGMDNIDLGVAKELGIRTQNTPAASSQSVAELAFAHIFAIARSLHLSNRYMPEKGQSEFNSLKKQYSKGFELKGSTLGVWGFGRIGRATADLGLAIGMKVLAYDPYLPANAVAPQGVKLVDKDTLLRDSNVISFHVPFKAGEVPLFNAHAFAMCKEGVVLINCARGGVIDEDVLLQGLETGKIGAAGLDVFENEPQPRQELMQHSLISVSPHIGASTSEAQERIGMEMAQYIIDFFEV